MYKWVCGKITSSNPILRPKHKMKRLIVDYEKLFGACYAKQAELADQLGVSQPTISRWVKGRTDLTLNNLNRIAEALSRSTTDFVLEVDAENLADYEHPII